MRLKIVASAIAGLALISCGNKASDSTTTTTGDTSTNTGNTTITTDNTSTGMIEAPGTARTAFESKFPQATNVRWNYHRPDVANIDWSWSGWPSMDTSDYVASFNWEGSDYYAWYDQDGNWIGSVNRVSDHASLPTGINNTIKNQYSGYNIVSVDRENDKNRTAYEIQLDKDGATTKLLVDENGKVLKKKDMSTGTKEKMNPKDTAM